MTARRTAARLIAAPAAAGAATLALAGPLAVPAGAHATITPTETAAGAYTVLTVSVSHGCDGAATTKLEIQIPEDILSVSPSRSALWDVTTKTVKLEKPLADAHGNQVTERDAMVVYTARTPLPEGYRDAVEISLKLPEKEGTTLAFPTVQTCEKGENAWVEVPTDGQDPEELEYPAPSLTITAAEDAHVSSVGSVKESAEANTDDGSSNALGAVGLGAGVLGLVAGGAALVQVRRRT